MKRLLCALILFISVVEYAAQTEIPVFSTLPEHQYETRAKRKLNPVSKKSASKRFKSIPTTPPLTATTSPASSSEMPALAVSSSSSSSDISTIVSQQVVPLAIVLQHFALYEKRLSTLEREAQAGQTISTLFLDSLTKTSARQMQRLTHIEQQLTSFASELQAITASAAQLKQIGLLSSSLAKTVAEHTQRLAQDKDILENHAQNIERLISLSAPTDTSVRMTPDNPELLKNPDAMFDLDADDPLNL